jgi:hypothetical protein
VGDENGYDVQIDEIRPPSDVIYEGTIEEIATDELPEPELLEAAEGGAEELVAAQSAIGARAVAIARGQAGVVESGGEDRGVPLERYVHYFGKTLPPLPWCAFFVSWSFAQASWRPPWRNPGLVRSIHDWAQANGRLVSRPAHGDIFGRNDMEHVGLVAGADPGAGEIYTIEGNYSDRVGSRLMSTAGLWFARV